MLRYLRALADNDFALDRGMIPLGLVHDEAQRHHGDGADHLARVRGPPPVRARRAGRRLPRAHRRSWSAGWPRSPATTRCRCSPTPAARASWPGCWPSAAYHRPAATRDRDVCLIPSSAHGTNAASAVMAGHAGRGRRVRRPTATSTSTTCARRSTHTRDRLAALMVTYPSTHGVYEDDDRRALRAGARGRRPGVRRRRQPQRAASAWPSPGEFGGDVVHLNLHKTFCIPHGGGGPGVGPVAVRAHLAPFLPNHPLAADAGPATGIGSDPAARSARPAILPISWAYMRMMGADGLTRGHRGRGPGRQLRRRRLAPHYPVLYTGRERPRRARVHPRPAADHQGDRRHRRGRGQAAHRLRLPRPHHVVPGRGHADGRAHRVRGPRRTRPLLRGDDRHPRRDRPGRRRRVARRTTARCATRRTPPSRSPRRVGPPYTAAGRLTPAGAAPQDKYWPPVRRIDGATATATCLSPARLEASS